MKLLEISSRIHDFLRKLEADPEINMCSPGNRIKPYYLPNSWASGRFVYVRYVNFQASHALTKAEAEPGFIKLRRRASARSPRGVMR